MRNLFLIALCCTMGLAHGADRKPIVIGATGQFQQSQAADTLANPGLFTALNYARGAGSPEGVVTAAIGAVYQNTTGGSGTTFYVKESGAGNTGWIAYSAGGVVDTARTWTTLQTFPDNTIKIVGSADNTKALLFETDSQTAGTGLTINSGAQSGNWSITVPTLAAAGYFVSASGAPATDAVAVIGYAHTGFASGGTSTAAYWANAAMMTSTNYAIKQTAAGTVNVNVPTGGQINFSVNNTQIALLNTLNFSIGSALSTAFNNTTASTSSSTGSITSAGGIGITNTTDSSSATNGGTITTAGGVAIAKKLYVGSSTNSTSSTTGALVLTAGGLAVNNDTTIGSRIFVTGDTQAPGIMVNAGNTQGTIFKGFAGGNTSPHIQSHGRSYNADGGEGNGYCAYRWMNDTTAGYYGFVKSRGTTVNSTTIVQSGDTLGFISAQGTDGAAAQRAALINFEVDGTPGAGDMPGRVRILVSADGSVTPTQAVKITNQRSVVIGDNAAAISTTATDGFLYVPSCAGIPAGTPTAQTGTVPICVDDTNGKAYIYTGGAWVALN